MGVKQFDLQGVVGGGLWEISLSRLINKNWFLKGKNSQYITLSAFNKIQKAYLEYTDKYINDVIYIYPNESALDNFAEFSFLLFSMDGIHALRPTTENTTIMFSNKFEPIYYDGECGFGNAFVDKDLNFKSYKVPSNLIKDSCLMIMKN